jgi:hypothetical protein
MRKFTALFEYMRRNAVGSAEDVKDLRTVTENMEKTISKKLLSYHFDFIHCETVPNGKRLVHKEWETIGYDSLAKLMSGFYFDYEHKDHAQLFIPGSILSTLEVGIQMDDLLVTLGKLSDKNDKRSEHEVAATDCKDEKFAGVCFNVAPGSIGAKRWQAQVYKLNKLYFKLEEPMLVVCKRMEENLVKWKVYC